MDEKLNKAIEYCNSKLSEFNRLPVVAQRVAQQRTANAYTGMRNMAQRIAFSGSIQDYLDFLGEQVAEHDTGDPYHDIASAIIAAISG